MRNALNAAFGQWLQISNVSCPSKTPWRPFHVNNERHIQVDGDK